MKKRLVSVILSAALAFTAVPHFALAAPTDYEVDMMETVETILDDVKADSDVSLSLRDEQRAALETATAAFYADGNFDIDAKWDAYINKVYDPSTLRGQNIKKYIQLRYIAKYAALYGAKGTTVADALAAEDATYATAGKTLAESYAWFDDFQSAMVALYQLHSSDADLFDNGEVKIEDTTESFDAYLKKSLLDATKNLFGIMFATQGKGTDDRAFQYSYEELFNKNDRTKKDIAVFYGSVLTKELATADNGIFSKIKNYVKTDDAAVVFINSSIADIFVADKDDAVKGAYALVGGLAAKAYASDAAKDEVIKFLGDGTEKGVFEIAMDVLDDADKSFQNIWVNLIIRQFVQMSSASAKYVTVTSENYTAPEKTNVNNNSSGKFVIEGLEDYGLEETEIALPVNYFNVVVEDVDSNVYYDSAKGKFVVSYDSTKPAQYDLNVVLYRSQAGTGVENYIEDYVITVNNKKPSSGGGSSSGSTRYPVEFVCTPVEGGTIEGNTSVTKGSTQKYEITAKPGYSLDKVTVNGVETAVTTDGNKAELVIEKITGKTIIAADFVKLLKDEDHISYIIGYPDGSFQPHGKVTREEVATIFFRLLTDDAREKYGLDDAEYPDVEDERWSNRAIATLTEMNIMKGYPDGSFQPSQDITRAEFATVAYRFYNMSYSGPDLFTDIAEHWAADYINAIADAKWIEGYEDHSYKPEQAINRAETVTIVNRMLSRSVNVENIPEGVVQFNDCDVDDWFYCAVVESSNTHDFDGERLEDGTEKWTELTVNPDWISYEK